MKNRKFFKSLKFKIILSSALSIIVVGIFSNAYLYSYLTGVIGEKTDSVELLYTETVENQLKQGMEAVIDLGNLCSNDLQIAKALGHLRWEMIYQKQDGIRAQAKLNTYLSTSKVEKYIEKFLVFNQTGLVAQGSTIYSGSILDVDKVRALPIFTQLNEGKEPYVFDLSPSIIQGKTALGFIQNVYDYVSDEARGWVYIELSSRLIEDTINLYRDGHLFVRDLKGSFVWQSQGENNEKSPLKELNTIPLISFPLEQADMDLGVVKATIEKTPYRIRFLPLGLTHNQLYVFYFADLTALNRTGMPLAFIATVVISTSLVVALFLTIILSEVITRPLARLTSRIKKISENDFSFDAEIERGSDEIADMGKVVNEMLMSINFLLKETEEMYVKQKNAEIALLQSQVNPHFLYNTLDSIRWMATIAQNPGIVKVAKSLSNLLKNLAKGVGDKISLLEEVKLLNDYVSIMSIRYMEDFVFENRISSEYLGYDIVKFTLQPLVENAIFHGIEPTDKRGKITIEAWEEGDFLFLVVEDNGVGMTEADLEKLQSNMKQPHGSSLSGIGVANVDNRLKLIYGDDFGLTYQSQKNHFTKVTVKIPKEKTNV